jgi:demethoxyubiquinone hydroxylase (CLK1/Coq7/Cat5 family)
MESLASSLRTMHLVEAIAVELYRGPQSFLREQKPSLSLVFLEFERGEVEHRDVFLRGLHEISATPFFFARWLSGVIGGLVSLVFLIFGVRALLSLEIAIEHIAVWHYGKILQRKQLPASWQEKVRSIRQDEIAHIQSMKELFTE